MGCKDSLKPKSFDVNICTSDVSCYDGIALSCVSIPSGAGLNQVISSIDEAICNIINNQNPTNINATNVDYTGDTTFTCFSFSGSPLTVQDVIEQLGNELCNINTNLSSTISNLCLSDIGLCGTLDPDSLFCLFGSTTPPALDPPNDNLEVLINNLMSFICTNKLEISGINNGGKLEGETGSGSTAVMAASDAKDMFNAFARYYGNPERSVKYQDGGITTSATDLNVTILSGKYFIEGWKVEKDNETILLDAGSDNYIDLSNDGTYTKIVLSVGSPEPPVTANSMRLWKITTDSRGVTATVDKANYYTLSGETFSDNSIITRHIKDLSVTGAKLEDVITAGSVGDTSIIEIVYDTKGRITGVTDNISISGLEDQDILIYNASTTKWENQPIVGTLLPSGSINETLYYDGSNWASSSLLTNTTSAIGVGINTGVAQATFTLGETATFGIQMAVPTGFSGGATTGGTLSAGTYYYVIVGYDGVNETPISSEVSVGVDGATTTAVSLSWDDMPNVYRYRVYKGVSTGVYTEYFELSTTSYIDKGDAGTAGSPTAPTNIDSYKTKITNKYALGRNANTASLFEIGNISSAIDTVIDIFQEAEVITGSEVDVYGMKITNNVANVGKVNYGQEIAVSGSDAENIGINILANTSGNGDNIGIRIQVANAGAGNAYALRILDGNEGSGRVLVSDALGNASWFTGGASGTFTTADSKTVTVVEGIITSIV